ncbi:ATP-binding protein [Synechococcus sp. PCC 7336]|uniref:sensor histidine kinase n=1 Tax=Synechococcus sp. PCC 7336 TaxID=195250 RepID=UPI00034A1E59|nr:ATP-binding protein [Synechococcus sp. PCC 7336]
MQTSESSTPTESSPPESNGFLRSFWQWWKDYLQELRLETRLLFAATLAVSLVVSGFTFWAVDTIQQDAQINDIRFGKDLALLLAADVAPLVAEGQQAKVARLSRQYFQSTSSIRYLLYADPNGDIYYGIPFSNADLSTSLTISRRLQLPEGRRPTEGVPLVRTHDTPDGRVTDIFVGIYNNSKFLGTLGLGINPNSIVVRSSSLTSNVTTGVFVAVWVLAILGAVFNALTITQPLKELVSGVQGISAGNFQQRINLPFGGELGQLIGSFNRMAEKLQRYEEQNIEELTAEKAKLETLVSTIVDGAVLLDPKLAILLVNPAALRLLNWQGKDISGQPVLDYLPEAFQLEIAPSLLAMARGELEGEEFRIALTEPNQRVVRVLLSTVLDRGRENLKSIAITIQDITREVALNEAQSQFISNVSHELRTPLFNIKSFIETLQEFGDRISPEERQDFLDTANRETDRLTRLVNDVLDLSRLASGRQYQFEAIDIFAPIDQTLRTYQLNARDKGIQLRQELDESLPEVWGNYDLLLQVFANLVGNALKFTPSGGEVAIRARRLQVEESDREVVRIEIADTGIGVDSEDRDKIFNRFFRAENRVHTLEGTGLGLSIVRNILEKHHTQIRVDSTPGKGSTFWFDLHQYSTVEPDACSLAS